MMTSAPYDLAIDSGGDRFPVTGAAPRLSWKPPRLADGGDSYELESDPVDGIAGVRRRDRPPLPELALAGTHEPPACRVACARGVRRRRRGVV